MTACRTNADTGRARWASVASVELIACDRLRVLFASSEPQTRGEMTTMQSAKTVLLTGSSSPSLQTLRAS